MRPARALLFPRQGPVGEGGRSPPRACEGPRRWWPAQLVGPRPGALTLRCYWARTAAYVPAAPRPRHSRGMTGLDRARGGLAPGRRAAWRGRPATAGMLGRITGRPSLQGGSRACAEATLRACQSKFAGPGRSRGSERAGWWVLLSAVGAEPRCPSPALQGYPPGVCRRATRRPSWCSLCGCGAG